MRIGTIIPVETMITKVNSTDEKHVIIDGTPVKRSTTLQVLATKGTKCVCCGIEGAYFMYFEDHNGGYARLMVYRNDYHGYPCFLTKDHIIPKTRGGPDIMDNYQVMCNTCNNKKGAKIKIKQVPQSLYKYLPKDLLRKTTPTTTAPKVDYLTLSIHKEYIVWYTKKFHKNASYKSWISSIRRLAQSRLRDVMGVEFSSAAFSLAYDQLISKQVSVRNETPSSPIMRPAWFFEKYP